MKQLLKYFKWYEYLIYFIALTSNIVVGSLKKNGV